MPNPPSTRLGLVGPTGSDLVSSGDDIIRALIVQLEAVGARIDHGTAAGRPAAAIVDRFYRATDTGVLSLDTGSAWVDINPVDAAAGTASLRTLGTGAQQAAAGNDARLSDARTPVAHAASHRPGGSDALAAVTSRLILDTGLLGQTRAGRVLTVADFTTLLGLTQPVGLFNLGDLTNLGSGGGLVNKGSVPFGTGITGNASEAAVFAGSTGQALYIADTGASDPFRIRTGSVGCWFRTAKRGTAQTLLAKGSSAALGWFIQILSSNLVQFSVYDGVSTLIGAAPGLTDVCDGRWHFVAGVHDGTVIRVYVDGVLEGQANAAGAIGGTAGPFNIGGQYADGSTAATVPSFGRVDEAFVTPDVLSQEQIRTVYAVKVAHGLGVAPNLPSLNVRRGRKGGPMVAGDFPSQPKLLYNFTAGALTDLGSLGRALTNNATTLSATGADGSSGGAFIFRAASSQYLSAVDTSLPTGTRSVGCWFKTVMVPGGSGSSPFSYASGGSAGLWLLTDNLLYFDELGASIHTAAPVNDGAWHFAVGVVDSAAADGLKVKLYIDGKLVASSTATPGTITLGDGLAVGRHAGVGSTFWDGSVDGAFVCDYALTAEQIFNLYAISPVASQPLSPKNAGDHVEAIDATNLYVVCDTLESQHTIDLRVAA